jgi:hypothetical protein
MDIPLSFLAHNLPYLIGFVFGSLILLSGLLIAVLGFATLRSWLSSAAWPEVPARVVTSEVREERHFEGQLLYRPVVEYTFGVGGGEVTCGNVAFATTLYPKRSRAEKVLSRYPAGMMVLARYNPDDPQEAVLVRRGGFVGLLVLLLGLAMIVGPLAAAHRAGLPAGIIGGVLAAVTALLALLNRQTRKRRARARRDGVYPPPGRGSDEDVVRLMRQGEKLMAIRLYRDIHATGLKEAKERVEEMAARTEDGTA